MANSDRPAGLKPYKGVQRRDSLILVPIDLDYGTNIFIQDAVMLIADHGIVQLAASDDAICGVALEFFDNNFKPILYYKAADYTAGTGLQCYALVCTDSQQRYIIQDDGAGSPTYSTIGNNADIVVGTGSSSSGVSAMEINGATLATTAALHLKIWGFERRTDNVIGDYCDWVVTLNQFQFPQCTATSFAVGGAGI